MKQVTLANDHLITHILLITPTSPGNLDVRIKNKMEVEVFSDASVAKQVGENFYYIELPPNIIGQSVEIRNGGDFALTRFHVIGNAVASVDNVFSQAPVVKYLGLIQDNRSVDKIQTRTVIFEEIELYDQPTAPEKRSINRDIVSRFESVQVSLASVPTTVKQFGSYGNYHEQDFTGGGEIFSANGSIILIGNAWKVRRSICCIAL